MRDGMQIFVTPADTLRVAFLRIDFLNDRGGSASTGNGHFDLSGPDTTALPIDPPPHNRSFFAKHLEALERFHDAQSYQRTIIVGDVWPRVENVAYHCTDMADLGPWKFSQDIYPQAAFMFRTMLMAADSQSVVMGDRIPWDQYDRVVVIHAGSDLQTDVLQDSPEDIPTFTVGVADTDVVWMHGIPTPGDSFAVDRATFAPETESQDGYFSTLNGVLAHECGHLFFGFADLYNIESGLPVVGYWSLMDSGNQVGAIVQTPVGEVFATGLLPPSVDPFQRQFTTDVLIPQEMVSGDTVTIQNIERHPDVRRVSLSSDEYLLLENRYLSPATAVQLDQDTLTHVILGPKTPDALEYDALLPGGGILVWHIDESVIPFEFSFPLDTSLRVNPDFGINTNPARLGVSVIEADGLADLGDLGSPFLFGSPFDPFFLSNYAVLSDTTHPNLITNTRTLPHTRLRFLDDPLSAMRVTMDRTWLRPGWPVAATFPPAGPQLLAVDADGDGVPEVCWAGGDQYGPDSTSLFAVRADGTGLFGPNPVFCTLDRHPLPVLAAVATGASPGGGLPRRGPALFAVTTAPDGPDLSTAGGRVWLFDQFGQPVPGWPATLPSIVTTPPVIVGDFPASFVVVGCADGSVAALRMDGSVLARSAILSAPVTGRLAAMIASGADSCIDVACADTTGTVAVFSLGACPLTFAATGWTRVVGTHGWQPDFLWMDLDGAGSSPQPVCGSGGPQLFVRGLDRVWGFCPDGSPIAGWGEPLGDTLVAGLGAGDVDGDGYPEVITQTTRSGVMYLNRGGRPAPGWPKRSTREELASAAAPLAADVRGFGTPDLVSLNGSGMLTAFNVSGTMPSGWPLGTGAGAAGSPLVADFNTGDNSIEIVAPDHLGKLYAFEFPTASAAQTATPWPMLGGDPGRTSVLPAARTSTAPAASAGPLLKGTFMAYPNPARRSPVTFAYTLSEPSRVQFEIVDTSGHSVASFTRDGTQAENIAVWEPGALPAGLYLARVKFSGSLSHHDQSEKILVGVLK
jgi:M6 family metalloprotease-like protein